jgi:uncharacterized repeat protein (TIGR02543 family)
MVSRLRLLLTIAFGLAVLAACGTEQPPVTDFELSVTVEGTGTGTVTSSPAGIDVTTGTDTGAFAPGTVVTLTATPAAGSVFEGWEGACTGTEPTCAVTMSVARTVTATFQAEAADYVLAVGLDGSGTGRVTSDPAGIDLTTGATTATFASGTVVTLTATADDGSVFAGWGGACAGTSATCEVTMNAARSVTATFSIAATNGVTEVLSRIAEGANSAEEFRQASKVDANDYPVGWTYTSSSDLELGFDPSHAGQYVGLRFTGLEVPQGAQIISAVIEFTALAAGESGRNVQVNLQVGAEATDDAPAFAQDALGTPSFGLSGRTLTPTTSWTIPGGAENAWSAGLVYTSADVSPVVQAVVDRAGWQSGNAMVIVIFATDAEATAFRRAQQAGANGPALRIVYDTPAP